MKNSLTSIALLLFFLLSSSGLADVVINEVELNLPEQAEQWVELYNSGDNDIDISGWSISPRSDPTKEEFIDLDNISAKEFYVLSFEDGWLDPYEEMLILRNETGIEVDRTPVLYDLKDSDCAWGRYPDGSQNWNFLISTKGGPSSGELCGDAESLNIKFDMDHSVNGSGYVRIRNFIRNRDDVTLKSGESGSGTYESEEAMRYYANLIGKTYTINLSKSDLSARYSNTTFSLSPKRSVRYVTKWSDSLIAGRDQDSPYISELYMYAKRLDSDVMIDYRNFDLLASIGSEFEGIGRINSNQDDFESSEEYIGSFRIFNNYLKNNTNKVELFAVGKGFVNTNKTIGDKVRTYERGTGEYRSEVLIDTHSSSLIDRRNVFLAKNISLIYVPANYSSTYDNPISMSLKWEEGTQSGEKDGTFMSSEFSDIRKLHDETSIISSGDMSTSADFSGKARLQAGYRDSLDTAQRFAYMDNVYLGNYSLKRRYTLFPILKVPHISIVSQGHIDPQDCNILKYTITLVNDGNRSLGPVFIRSSIPTGTSFLDASIQPFELASRYANWSISYLGIGESFNIDLDLQITTRRENYTSSSRAVTIYQAITATTSRDRKLRASNTSRLVMDWSACSPRSLSATYSATSNSRNPKTLTYRLTVQNLAEENMSLNIKATLPHNISFINSTTQPEQISEDMILWTIDKLNAGKRRTISFKVEAESDGFYVSRADVHARSLDGNEMTSLNVSASLMVGKTVYVITPTFWKDWCPCDENLLGSQSWNETMIRRGMDLGCVC
jgi:uncharacterized repeat protein (TIGR01451 family)